MSNFENDWEENQRPVELSADDVNESQMEALIKEFIQPGGSEYGLTPEAYQARERTVRKQIATGSLKIVFDASTDTTMLMSSQDWRKLQSQ